MINLLQLIKSILYVYGSKSHPFLEVYQATKTFYSLYQQNTTLCGYYMESMTNLRNDIVHCGGTLGDHNFLVNKKLKQEKWTLQVAQVPHI